MRVRIAAVGRLRQGPQKTLCDDYLARFGRTGRALSLGPAEVVEIDERRGGGMAAEADLLRRAIPPGALVCALDERGRSLTSPDFAAWLAAARDAGRADAVFVIGGADGLAPDLVRQADLALSLGAMVWPHLLVRVMLAEQLYRAATILSGGPYHRA
jgi:23S rRNA (pseudouridine1915-N3)-methyltransferase